MKTKDFTIILCTLYAITQCMWFMTMMSYRQHNLTQHPNKSPQPVSPDAKDYHQINPRNLEQKPVQPDVVAPNQVDVKRDIDMMAIDRMNDLNNHIGNNIKDPKKRTQVFMNWLNEYITVVRDLTEQTYKKHRISPKGKT